MRIFHIATLADWKQAEADGTYTTSTYGVTLAEAGFIHAARHEQVRGVLDTHYADVTEPLVVLEIETDLLDVPWRDDDVDGVLFPHVYGPLTTQAVVRWRPARLPPIEAAPRPPRPPLPPIVAAFYGVTVILGAVAVTFAIFGLVAHAQVNDLPPDLPFWAEFWVWTSAAVCGVAAAAALAVGWLLGQQASGGPTDPPAAP